MSITNFLSGAISPKLGVSMLKNQIEKQTNTKVKSFDLIYQVGDPLQFIIEPINGEPFKALFADSDNTLTTLLKEVANKHLTENTELKAFVLRANEQIKITLYYIQENNKKYLEILL